MSTSGRKIYAPKEDFVAPYGGADVTFSRGRTLVREGHPILGSFGHLFEEVNVEFDVEEATAEPGKRRQR